MQLVPRLILHIGAWRTGTSSIQRALLDFSDPATPNELYYPYAIPPQRIWLDQHSELARAIIKRQDSELESFFEQVVENARQKGANTVILSGEEFMVLNMSEVRRLKSFMERFFERATIVAFFRDTFKYVQSSALQHLKAAGYFLTPAEFASRIAAVDFDVVVATWTEVFSAEAVRFGFLGEESDSVVRFFETTGLDACRQNTLRRNSSLDFVTASLLNALGFDLRSRPSDLQELYERNFDQRFKFSSENLFWNEVLEELPAHIQTGIAESDEYAAWRARAPVSAEELVAYLKCLREFVDALVRMESDLVEAKMPGRIQAP